MKKLIGETWEQLSDTKFVLQCQTRTGMRLVKSDTEPTSPSVGYELKDGDTVNTDSDTFLEGICWIRSASGEGRSYEYDALV